MYVNVRGIVVRLLCLSLEATPTVQRQVRPTKQTTIAFLVADPLRVPALGSNAPKANPIPS